MTTLFSSSVDIVILVHNYLKSLSKEPETLGNKTFIDCFLIKLVHEIDLKFHEFQK